MTKNPFSARIGNVRIEETREGYSVSGLPKAIAAGAQFDSIIKDWGTAALGGAVTGALVGLVRSRDPRAAALYGVGTGAYKAIETNPFNRESAQKVEDAFNSNTFTVTIPGKGLVADIKEGNFTKLFDTGLKAVREAASVYGKYQNVHQEYYDEETGQTGILIRG